MRGNFVKHSTGFGVMPYEHASSLSDRTYFLYHVSGNMHRRADLRRLLDIAEAVEGDWRATPPDRAKVRAGFTVEQMASGLSRYLPLASRHRPQSGLGAESVWPSRIAGRSIAWLP